MYPIAKRKWPSIHPRNFGSHITIRPNARPSVCSPHRETNLKCNTLKLQCGSLQPDIVHPIQLLWSIDSCQNRVSADQNDMTVSGAQVLSHRGRKALDNNDVNKVVASSGFSENRGRYLGSSVSRAHKTWSRSFLFNDFHRGYAFFFFKFTANKFLVFNWISFLQCFSINGSFAFSLC